MNLEQRTLKIQEIAQFFFDLKQGAPLKKRRASGRAAIAALTKMQADILGKFTRHSNESYKEVKDWPPNRRERAGQIEKLKAERDTLKRLLEEEPYPSYFDTDKRAIAEKLANTERLIAVEEVFSKPKVM
jgi:hypothetical protein